MHLYLGWYEASADIYVCMKLPADTLFVVYVLRYLRVRRSLSLAALEFLLAGVPPPK